MNHRLHSYVIIPVFAFLSNLFFAGDIPDDAIREGSRILQESGRMERVYLNEPSDIDGVRFQGWTWFDSSGALSHSVLAEDLPFGEIILPAGSTVFYKDGVIDRVWLAHDMEIYGLPINGGGKVETGFYPNGHLKFCCLAESHEIDGVLVKGGTLTPVYFTEDGGLFRCTLAAPYEVGDESWPGGTEVWLNPDGSVKQSYRPGLFTRMGKELLDMVF